MLHTVVVALISTGVNTPIFSDEVLSLAGCEEWRIREIAYGLWSYKMSFELLEANPGARRWELGGKTRREGNALALYGIRVFGASLTFCHLLTILVSL